MAVDYDAALATIHSVGTKVGELRTIIETAKAAKATVAGIGDIDFTPAQKATLLTKYGDLKTDVTVLIGQLP